MTITGYSARTVGNVTTVTLTSDLVGAVYYHWYEEGRWLARTTEPVHAFHVPEGEQLRIEAIDTLDPAFDYLAAAPACHSRRRTIWWVRSAAPFWLDSLTLDELGLATVDQVAGMGILRASSPAGPAVSQYLVQQQPDGGDWTTIAKVPGMTSQWEYAAVSPILEDLTTHLWRIIPVDCRGNEGAPLVLEPELIVRHPDAPRYEIDYLPSVNRARFSQIA